MSRATRISYGDAEGDSDLPRRCRGRLGSPTAMPRETRISYGDAEGDSDLLRRCRGRLRSVGQARVLPRRGRVGCRRDGRPAAGLPELLARRRRNGAAELLQPTLRQARWGRACQRRTARCSACARDMKASWVVRHRRLGRGWRERAVTGSRWGEGTCRAGRTRPCRDERTRSCRWGQRGIV